MSEPRWIADEMLGRLARYLRIVGSDTLYARGVEDREILRLASAEDRVVLTRDRLLAHRAPRSLWIASPRLAEQWAQLRAAWPALPQSVAFARCTVCNGELALATVPAEGWEPRVPRGVPVWRCGACGHLYWDGTHTVALRRRLADWAGAAEP